MNNNISVNVIMSVVKQLKLYQDFMFILSDMDISGSDEDLDKMNEIHNKLLGCELDSTICYLESWIDEQGV